jgi:diguanylate cyclase (GGDEF)-like protein
VYRVAGTIEDITDRRRMDERLQRQAHFDSLTGLPNRVLFFDRLNYALAQAKRHGRPVALLFVDVDRFKIVNDTLGHAMGDKLLQGIAECLRHAVRAEDTVARLGGDEFAIVLPRLERPEHAALVAEKALTCLARPFVLEGREVVTSASIGVALSSSDGSDAQSLLKRADKAMFQAKAGGRNGYAFYTAPMPDAGHEQYALERNLRRALEREEFVLHFQPKRNIADGTISGCEGLLRWATAAGELIEPLRFIPVLEESGLIRSVGAWVIRAVCRQIVSWRKLGLERMPVAVNLSVKQFDGGDVAQIVETALREHELDGSLLQIELTESAAMENLEETMAVLGKLKSHGVTIAIDDFGTGHSNLSYLKRLPIDVLKIDSSFIVGVPENENDASIVHAIITMAHSLGIRVIAEGVETDEQLAFLAEHGCDEMQGYLFSAPLPSGELARFASTRIS